MKHQSDLDNHAFVQALLAQILVQPGENEKSKKCSKSIVSQLVPLLKKSSSLLDKLNLSVLTFFVLSFVLQNPIYASWYDQKLEGWYYFEDKSHNQEKSSLTPEEADEFLTQESTKLKQLLSLAILSPTKENVESYIRNQRQWITQSSNFANSWGKVLLEHPELGDFLTNPTSSYGILAKRAYDQKQRVALLQKLSQTYFLVFFFKGQDMLAQKAAEVAQLFATTNGWKYKAVSLDGAGLPQLHEFETDKGLGNLIGAKISPSFYIINPAENQVYPVGAGLISVSELEANIETQLGETHE